MRKQTTSNWLILGLLLIVFSLKSQTCSSPLTLTVNGNFTSLDSTLTTRYFKFNAVQSNVQIKFWIKNYTSSGNYQLKLFTNDCASIPSNSLLINPIINGDSVSIIQTGLIKGNDYLIELSKINPSSNYIVYSGAIYRYGSDASIAAYICPGSNSCTPTSTCELVCNGSFECFATTTYSLGQVNFADNWGPATYGTPDLFQTFSSYSNAKVPCNYFGNQTARTGNSYAGIIWSTNNSTYMEYLQTKLKSTMQFGKKYIISFYISRGDNARLQINELGIFLRNTVTSETITTSVSYANSPNATITNTTVLNDPINWQRVSFCYTSSGNENYLVIGRPTGTTPTALNSSVTPACTYTPEVIVPFDQFGYLYIEDVSVQLMEVDAGPNQTICPGQSAFLNPIYCPGIPDINMTFAWTPTTGLSSPTFSNTFASPTNTTTYNFSVTATGSNSLSCTVGDNVTVNVYPTTTLTIVPSQTLVCPNSTVSLTASGGAVGTYTWLPGNYTVNPVVYTQTATTTYTVNAKNTYGCLITQTITISTATVSPNFTLTPNPATICAASGSLTTSTITAAPAGSYTWNPTSTVSPTMLVTAAGPYTFTVSMTNTIGCVLSKTVEVGVTEESALFNPLPTICGTQTLNLANYSSPSGMGTYSINGTQIAGSVFTPSTTGTFIVGYTYTAGILCGNTATTTINVINLPTTPTITSSTGAMSCAGGNFTLTASPAGSYTWQPGGFIGNPYITTQTGLTNYIATTGAGNCTVSANMYIDFDPTPCVCLQNCSSNLQGNINGPITLGTNSVYCVTQDISITGAVTFSNSDFRIAPTKSIVVSPSSTLTIAGCHLYACENMWQGIVVQPGGVLNCIISSTGKTTFIEDAYIAIESQPYTLTVTPTTILNVNNVTFNRNQVAIKINKYDQNQTTYPFTIANSLFTSRTITFSPLSWPTTNTVKNTTFTPSSPLQTPYLNNTTYPLTTLKNPLSSIPSGTAIILNDVGYTSVPSAPAYKVINIGQTGASNYNVFDNHYECITANNSNVTVFNSIFQNGVRYGRGSASGGKAIVATSTQPSYTTGIAVNNQIRVVPGSGTSFFNKFYDMTRCVEVNGYLSTEIAYNEVYSYTNAYPNFTSINTFGGIGFVINTNRYFSMKVNNNKMYNIKNCVQFDIGSGDFVVGSLSGSGRYIGSCNIFSNTISKHPTTPVSNEYVNIGVSVNDAFTASSVTFAPVGGAAFSIYSNTMTNVHNGIGAYNIAYTPVTILSNSITMALEPNTWYALPAQGGINAFQMNNTSVHLNNITGPTTYTVNDIRAIKTSMNSQLSVKCNTTSTTGRGLDFNASQPVTTVQDNIMQNQTYGLALDNNGVIGTQGNSTTPTNNQWLGTWTGGKTMTFNYDNNASAQYSPIYVQWGATGLDPNGSSTTPFGTPLFDDYFHNSIGPNTLLNVTTTLTPTCRLGGGGGGGKLMGQVTSYELAEDLVLDSISYTTNGAETRYIDKNRVYKMILADAGIKSNSGILNNFSLANSVSAFQKYNDIEEAILSKKTSQANGLITTISPANTIEGNYKKYYQLLLKAKIGSLNSNDSTSLFTLANSCPFTEGGSVYQARALYNQLFSVYLSYIDNCTFSNSRLANGFDEDVKVMFNTFLYPNPNNGTFTIESKAEKIGTLEITDMFGRTLLRQIVNAGKVSLQTELSSGLYLIKVTLINGKVDQHQFVISK